MPVIWSAILCDDSIMILFGSFDDMYFKVMTGAIVVVDYFAGCIFASESTICIFFSLG